MSRKPIPSRPKQFFVSLFVLLIAFAAIMGGLWLATTVAAGHFVDMIGKVSLG